MRDKLNALVGKKVIVYGVAEGLSISHLATLIGPTGIGHAFSVGESPTMITFHLGNVKSIQGNAIELSVLEPRTSKLIRKQTKK